MQRDSRGVTREQVAATRISVEGGFAGGDRSMRSKRVNGVCEGGGLLSLAVGHNLETVAQLQSVKILQMPYRLKLFARALLPCRHDIDVSFYANYLGGDWFKRSTLRSILN